MSMTLLLALGFATEAGGFAQSLPGFLNRLWLPSRLQKFGDNMQMPTSLMHSLGMSPLHIDDPQRLADLGIAKYSIDPGGVYMLHVHQDRLGLSQYLHQAYWRQVSCRHTPGRELHNIPSCVKPCPIARTLP